MTFFVNNQYPIFSNPRISSDCAMELQRYMQAPLPLIGSSLLGAMSSVVQRHVDVRWLYDMVSPTGLFILVQAESGERKSAVDKFTMQVITEFNNKQLKAHDEAKAQFKLNHSAWKRKLAAKSIIFKKMIREEMPTDDIENEIRIIENNEPKKPKVLKLLTKDSTIEAISQRLQDNDGCLSVVTAEGGLALDGRIMSNPYLLNDAWSGEPIDVDRKSVESIYVENPRLTMSIMLQPTVMQEIYKKHGVQLRGNGLFARFLHCVCPSTQGTRFIANPTCTWEYLPKFQARLKEILDMPVLNADGTPKQRTILSLTPEAEQALVNFYNRIEFDLGQGQYLSDVRDGASKITENAARIAAIFHFFEGIEGDISLLTMSNALLIAEYYMHEFKFIFGSNNQIPVEVQDAMAIEQFLIRMCKKNPGKISFPKNLLLQKGPNHLRHDRVRRESALNVLVMNNKVLIAKIEDTKHISLNPIFFPLTNIQQQSFNQPLQINQHYSARSYEPGIV